jgi:uncharacterized protein (TIGR02594 family)
MSYDWLKHETAPKILVEAVKHIGVKEIIGRYHSETIIGWAQSLDLEDVYTNDEIPWCGLYIAYCCHAQKLDVVKNPLWALNWNKYGTKTETPMLGDVLTFTRNGGGHVGLYVGEDITHYHVLGGNQNNMVSVSRIAKTRLNQARRTAWKIAQPANVRVIKLEPKGVITTNEK